ncbi:MAG: hypothetical protein IPK59_04480 [Rhodospirillaceae bacterium]|nr:hypothetical protein [Rhodospirillaceae bacterium]
MTASMPFFPNNHKRSAGFGAVLFTTLAAVYPVIVYFLHDQASYLLFAAGACCLLLVRALFVRDELSTALRIPLLLAACAIGGLSMFDAAMATKGYPALLSLIIASAFGTSLWHPPSLIERLARFKDPDLTPAGQAYCRKVTWVWTLWLLLNAAIAAVLALWASLALWTLWTGLISYLFFGVLFLGEVVLRPWLQRRAAVSRQ